MNAEEMKAALFAADDLKPSRVVTPEWAPELPVVWCRALTADELVSLGDLEDERHEMRTVAALTMCTEEGEPLGLTELEVIALGKKHQGPVKRVYDESMRLSGLNEKGREELLGNLSALDSDGSG